MFARYLVLVALVLGALAPCTHSLVPLTPPTNFAPAVSVVVPSNFLNTPHRHEYNSHSSNSLREYAQNFWLAENNNSNNNDNGIQQTALRVPQVAPPSEILRVLQDHKDAVILDARRPAEILENGYLRIPGHRWVYASCSLDECSLLEQTAESLIPDKSSTFISGA